MFRLRCFSNFLGTAYSRKDRRRQPERQHCSVRLTLEQLEDRMTPSQMTFNPGVGALFPETQFINPIIIEVQIFKQIPYLQYWNSWFQQNTGMALPGVSDMFTALETTFPSLASFAHF